MLATSLVPRIPVDSPEARAVIPNHTLAEHEDLSDVIRQLFRPHVALAQREYDCCEERFSQSGTLPEVGATIVIDCGDQPDLMSDDVLGPHIAGLIWARSAGGVFRTPNNVIAFCSHRERIGGRLFVSFQAE